MKTITSPGLGDTAIKIPRPCLPRPFGKKGMNTPGFSLLELIFALGILSLGFLFLSGLSVTTMKTNKNSQNRTAALQLAQEKIESLKTLSFFELRGGVESGLLIGTLGTPFQRETIVQRGSRLNLADVTVRVSWSGSAKPEVLHFTELFTRIAG